MTSAKSAHRAMICGRVNHPIIDFASFIVTRAAWLDQLSTHVASQGSSGFFGEHLVLTRSKRYPRNQRRGPTEEAYHSAFQNLTETKKWWFLFTKLLSVKHRRAQLASDFYDYVCGYIRALSRQADRLGARRLVEAIGLFLVGT
jgi:hypothetical protein